VVAEFSWRELLRLRRRSARLGPPASVGAARFDWNKVHPSWRPGVGFELRLGDRPGTPITLDGLRTHIAAARVVHGEEEADRLQAELDGLLAIKERCEASAPTGIEAGHADADVR